jgi:AcrR family transcriptional regulator
MPKLAADRTTHLTPHEIAAEALRQFDAGPGEPSIRSLAAALGVAPAAIYHHFAWQRAVDMVWEEASRETVALVPHPFSSDPVDVLVAVGLGTRRAWMRHHRLSRHLAANPESGQFHTDALGLLASVFEAMGMSPEEAAAAFHSYATFMVGAVLFAAFNRTANELLAAEVRNRPGRFRTPPSERALRHSTEKTRDELDRMMELAIRDPQRDEEMFTDGLRRLIESLAVRRGPHSSRTQGAAGHR